MVVNVDETKAALASKVRLQKVRKAKKSKENAFIPTSTFRMNLRH